MSGKPLAMRDALLDRIWRSMGDDREIFFVSADFGSPVLDRIRSDFGDRFVNVGVAEQNLINVSAGLALEGYKVFAYAIAPFITMRCYEQTRVSLALLSEVREMNVNLIGVGAGYSYVLSGPTHQCYEDITLMRAMPNFRVYSPADHVTAAALFETCRANLGPKYLRLDAQVLPVVYESATPDITRGFEMLRTEGDVCLVSTGYMTHTALQVAAALEAAGRPVGVIDLFDLATFSREQLARQLARYRGMVTLEEGFHGRGGMDSMLFEFVSESRLPLAMCNIGVEGKYRFEIGTRTGIHEIVGIGPEVVRARVTAFAESLSS